MGRRRGLRWANECRHDISGAIELAQKRRIDEAVAACRAAEPF